MQENNPQRCNTLLPAYSVTTRASAAERSIASISVWRVTARSKSTSNPVPEAKACAGRRALGDEGVLGRGRHLGQRGVPFGRVSHVRANVEGARGRDHHRACVSMGC
jgi:hypothetical protein